MPVCVYYLDNHHDFRGPEKILWDVAKALVVFGRVVKLKY